MKVTFIWSYSHPLHKAWADSVSTNNIPFIHQRFLKFRSSSPIVHQGLSIVRGLKIPKSDVYLIEGMNCALPAIMNKNQK